MRRNVARLRRLRYPPHDRRPPVGCGRGAGGVRAAAPTRPVIRTARHGPRGLPEPFAAPTAWVRVVLTARSALHLEVDIPARSHLPAVAKRDATRAQKRPEGGHRDPHETAVVLGLEYTVPPVRTKKELRVPHRGQVRGTVAGQIDKRVEPLRRVAGWHRRVHEKDVALLLINSVAVRIPRLHARRRGRDLGARCRLTWVAHARELPGAEFRGLGRLRRARAADPGSRTSCKYAGFGAAA